MQVKTSLAAYTQLEKKIKNNKLIVKMVSLLCVNTFCFLFYISIICNEL